MKASSASPPAQPGAYVLWFTLDQDQELVVGRLGRRMAPAGHLVYVGSALGAGGLRSRLRRHFGPVTTLHWHVDYLRAVCAPTAAWFAVDEERQECRWVSLLAAVGATYPIPSFGNSDCRSPRCPAHLLRVPPTWTGATIEEILPWTTRCLLPF